VLVRLTKSKNEGFLSSSFMGNTDKAALDSLRIDRSQSRRGSRWPWILVLLCLGAAGAWFLKFQRAPLVVSTVTVIEQASSRGTAPSPATVLNASGYVNARRQATVSSKTTGKIIEVLIEEGMQVKEGDVLARLDSSNLDTSFRLAVAQLNSARSALAETRVRLEQAQREFRRVRQLVEEKVASASDYDNAEAEAGSLEARLIRQEAEIAVAERQIELYQQQLEDLIIRAPFSGVVVSKDAQPGEMISPVSAGGGFTRTGICTLVDMSSLEIEIDVNEAYINRVKAGQPVSATLDAYPGWKIPGHVIAIIPTADRQKATVKVRIAFDELDDRILPDMGIKVAFQETTSAEDSQTDTPRKLVVPASAIRSADGRDFVWLLDNGVVTRRNVSVGGRENDLALIDSGLSAGESVIVGDPEPLEEGQRATNSEP
jgi:RND family efflux transporter MFP subunit